jgi:tetratricopeptide (TPR) repeat protein
VEEALLREFRRAEASGDHEAVALAMALDRTLVTSGRSTLHRHVLESALAIARASAMAEVVDLEWALARQAALRGEHGVAVEHATRACAGAHDDRQRTWTASILCFACRALGRFDEARAAATTARAAATTAEEIAYAEQVGGLLELALDRFAEAASCFERAAVAARRVEHARIEGIALANLAHAHVRRGAWGDAEVALAAASAAFARAGDRVHRTMIATLEAELLRRRGDPDAARRTLLDLLDDARAHDDLGTQIAQRVELGWCALARDDAAEAVRWYEEALALARRGEDVLLARAVAELAAALPERAREVLRVARDGASIALGARVVDLRRRGPLRRVVLALVAARPRALDVTAMIAAGWPGERMRAESGVARVYMAVRRLRALGVPIVTVAEGYAPDPAVVVVRM